MINFTLSKMAHAGFPALANSMKLWSSWDSLSLVEMHQELHTSTVSYMYSFPLELQYKCANLSNKKY